MMLIIDLFASNTCSVNLLTRVNVAIYIQFASQNIVFPPHGSQQWKLGPSHNCWANQHEFIFSFVELTTRLIAFKTRETCRNLQLRLQIYHHYRDSARNMCVCRAHASAFAQAAPNCPKNDSCGVVQFFQRFLSGKLSPNTRLFGLPLHYLWIPLHLTRLIVVVLPFRVSYEN